MKIYIYIAFFISVLSCSDSIEADRESSYDNALSLYREMNYSKALEILDYVFITSSNNEKSELLAKSLYLRGFIYYLEDDSKLAYADYLKAIEVADAIGDGKMVSRLHNEIGQIFYESELYEQSLIYFQLALKNSDEATTQDKAYYYYGIGKSLRILNRLEEGLQAFIKAIEINEKLRNNDALAGDYIELAKLQTKAGNYEMAFEHYDKVLELAELTMNPNKYYWMAHNNMGYISILLKDFEKAELYLNKALVYNENSDQIWVTYNNLGKVNNEKGDYAKAWEYFRKSLKYNSEKGELNELAITNNALKKTFENLNQPDSLLHYTMLINELALPRVATQSWLYAEEEKIALLTKYQEHEKKKAEEEQYARISWLVAFIMTFIFMSGLLSVRLWRIYHYKSPEKAHALIRNPNEMVYLLDLFKKEKDEMKKVMDEQMNKSH